MGGARRLVIGVAVVWACGCLPLNKTRESVSTEPGSSSSGGLADGGTSSSGPGDSSGVIPGYDPCAPDKVIDLAQAGTRTGPTTVYRGSTAEIPAGDGWPAACVPQDAPRHLQAFRYVLTTNARLVVSSFHADTAEHLDTVIWAQDACTPEALSLGCNDDVSPRHLLRSPEPAAGAERQSLFTTAGTMLPAETEVFLFLAGYQAHGDTWLEAGPYTLSVTEVNVPSTLDGPCDPDAAPMVCAPELACRATGSEYSEFSCREAGARGQPCRDQGTPCADALACTPAFTCVDVIPAGQACDPHGAANVCASGSSCQDPDGSARCVADGTQGGLCRGATPTCDAELTCDGQFCGPRTPLGGPCDPAVLPSPCGETAHCLVPPGQDGGATLCVPDGILGAACHQDSASCNGSLACFDNRCVVPTPVGQPCQVVNRQDACAAGSHCVAAAADGGTLSCTRDGTLGAHCARTSPPCGSGLACLKTDPSTGGTCVDALARGEACDPAFQSSLCGRGMVCVSSPDAGAKCQQEGYSRTSSSAEWVDACAAPGAQSLLSNVDNDPAPFTLPFDFPFFGVRHAAGSTGTLSPDGWLSFQPHQGRASTPLPLPALAPDDTIFALWMDLTLATGTAPSEACLATVGTAPQRTLVVQWNQAGFRLPAQAGDGVTLEVQLHEGHGDLDLLYNTLTGTEAFGVATVGLQSAGGTAWVQRCAGQDGGCNASQVVNARYAPQ